MPDRIEGGESLQNHRSQSGNNNSHFITGSFLQGHKTLQYPQFLRKGWVRGASFFAARNALFQKISRQAGIRALDREDESWLEQEVYSAPPKKPGLFATLMALVTGVSLQVTAKRSIAGTATVTAPTVRPTMDTAMDGGTMERAINTAASLAAIKAARTEFQQFRILTAKYIESGSRSSLAPGSFFVEIKRSF